MLGSGTAHYVGPTETLLPNPGSVEDVKEGEILGLKIPEKEQASPSSSKSSLGGEESRASRFSDSQSRESPWINMHQVEPNSDAEDGIERYFTSSSDISSSSFGRPKSLDIREERRETGRTKFSVYKRYLRAASTWPWVYWWVVISLLIGYVFLWKT